MNKDISVRSSPRIGGWLILLSIDFFWMPVYLLLFVIIGIPLIFHIIYPEMQQQLAFIEALTRFVDVDNYLQQLSYINNQLQYFFLIYKPYLLISYIAKLCMLVVYYKAFILYLRKSAQFPTRCITIMFISLGYYAGDTILRYIMLSPYFPTIKIFTLPEIIITIFLLCRLFIWIPYIEASLRVKATFIY